MDLKRPRVPWNPRRPEAAGQPAEELEASPSPPEEPHEPLRHPVEPVVVPRWLQMVLVPLGLLGLWALARAAGSVLLVLVVACLVALLLNPFVKRLQRVMPRGLAILLTYLACFAVLAAIGLAMANLVSTQVSHFSDQVPSLVHHANHDLTNLQKWLNRNGIKVRIQEQGQTALQTLQKRLVKSSGSIVSFSRDLLSKVVTIGFDLVLILVLSIYLLVYAGPIGELVRRIVPPGDGTPEDDFPLLVQRAVSGYMRGAILFSIIMGTSAGIALWIFGVTGIFPDGAKYTVFFASFYGLMEFIPYVGPIIGPAPAVLVALFQDPISAVWVVLLFVALQQLEGHFVAPQVFRISLRINPILVILSLLIGYKLYGIIGALVALPVAAVIRASIIYLRRHLVLEPWSVSGPGTGILGHGAPEPCPDCGAATRPDDAFCRACGASLEPRVRTPG